MAKMYRTERQKSDNISGLSGSIFCFWTRNIFGSGIRQQLIVRKFQANDCWSEAPKQMMAKWIVRKDRKEVPESLQAAHEC